MPSVPTHVAFDRRFLEKSRHWFANPELRALTATPPVEVVQQEQWYASLPRPGYHLWGILYEGEPVGVFGLKNVTAETGEYWGYIGEKSHWGLGIGRWMLERALAEARHMALRRVYLRVLPANVRAVALYQKLGFEEVPAQAAQGFLHMELPLAA